MNLMPVGLEQIDVGSSCIPSIATTCSITHASCTCHVPT